MRDYLEDGLHGVPFGASIGYMRMRFVSSVFYMTHEI